MTAPRWLLRPYQQTAQQAAPAMSIKPTASVLVELDPIATPPDADMIATVVAFLRQPGGDPETRLLWGRYAYHGARRLFGRDHRLSWLAGGLFQDVLVGQGLTFDAVVVCAERLAAYRRLQDPVKALLTRVSLADVLHGDGQCEQAACEIRAAHHAARRWPQHALRIALTDAVIEAGCGRTPNAVRLLKNRRAVYADLDHEGRHAAARWLAHAEATHPRVCTRASAALTAAVGDRAGRASFWSSVLDGPTTGTAQQRRDHRWAVPVRTGR